MRPGKYAGLSMSGFDESNNKIIRDLSRKVIDAVAAIADEEEVEFGLVWDAFVEDCEQKARNYYHRGLRTVGKKLGL